MNNEVTYLSPKELKPHPDNYRLHGETQLKHIKESIKANGVYRNIIVSDDGYILAGHGVVQACVELEVPQIPVIQLDIGHKEPAALKVLTGDNEISNLGDIDDRKLSEILKDIADMDDLLGTGFDEMQLANLVYVTRPQSEIEDFDAAKEWVGLPAYDEETPGESSKVKVTIEFANEEDRLKYIEEKGIKFKSRQGKKVWTTSWPFQESNDRKSVKFEVEE